MIDDTRVSGRFRAVQNGRGAHRVVFNLPLVGRHAGTAGVQLLTVVAGIAGNALVFALGQLVHVFRTARALPPT